MKLKREFYRQDGISLARALIGKTLVHRSPDGVTQGMIIETEAYMGYADKAAHSYKKNSKRVNVQYGDGGYVYMYLIYGMYDCFNIVANCTGTPEAVLVRALAPLSGLDLMQDRRGTIKMKNLCSGPGKLCKAMALTMAQYGADLCGDKLYIEDRGDMQDFAVSETPRINVDYAEEARDYLWRFCMKGHPMLSRKDTQVIVN